MNMKTPEDRAWSTEYLEVRCPICGKKPAICDCVLCRKCRMDVTGGRRCKCACPICKRLPRKCRCDPADVAYVQMGYVIGPDGDWVMGPVLSDSPQGG